MPGWLKLHYEIVHDPKMRALAFEDRWHFVALLCMKGEGLLDEDPEIVDQLVEVTLGLHGTDLSALKERLSKLKLINYRWEPINWEKRQLSKDKTGAYRQRKYRENKKKELSEKSVTEPSRQSNAQHNGQKKEVRSKNNKNTCSISLSGFDEFWNAYGKKLNKSDAEKAWIKLTPEERKLATDDARVRKTQDPQWAKDNGQFQPYAGTYLRNKKWTDEWQSEEPNEHYF